MAIISIVILILSVIVHEVSHGYMAEWLGDPTPRLQGRLTLNPLRHIDPVGSVIVPLLTSLSGFTFGWAKPVEYNPYNLKDKRRGEFLIALAGPASNIALALLFGLAIRAMAGGHIVGDAAFASSFVGVASLVVIINIVLAIFNLIPLPPLDGSKLFLAFMPRQFGQTRMLLERLGPISVLIAVFLLWQIISPLVPLIFSALTGLS